MSSSRIAMIGTDLVSVSMALALQKREESIELVGYDADPAVADLANVRGAFDDVERKPGLACEGAELVVVAQPLTKMEGAFAVIAPHLGEGAVVTDTARLKTPVLRWASDLLPERVSFVGGHPIPNPAVVGLRTLEGLDDADADLLREALYCFTPAPSTSSSAIDVCSWLAHAVGANPFFINVKEHDGLLAGVEGLPDVLTIALLRATVDTPGWEEMRKFAGRRFATVTEAVDDMDTPRSSLFLNRQNVLQRLDALIEELIHLRNLLKQGDEEALSETVAEAARGRSQWMKQRRQGMWTDKKVFDTR
ncbi:MAG: prephenate dehydrogenase/arogenate dehydrogenase family protein, partial [Anaerolineae bacterium]